MKLATSVAIAAVCVATGLAAALATGPVRDFDRYSATHLMPGRASIPVYVEVADGRPAVALAEPHPGLARKAHFVWGPFSRLFSSVLIVGLCAYAVIRRREWVRPLGWLAGFAVANLAALLLQDYLRRPDLIFAGSKLRYSVDAYAASFPSGYSVRVVFAAIVTCALWRWGAAIALPVTVAVIAAVIGGGSHLPTDVIGGAAIAVAAFVFSSHLAASIASLLQRRVGTLRLRADEVERPPPDHDTC